MTETKKKKRLPNFTDEEMLTMIAAVTERKEILFNKLDKKKTKTKAIAWLQVTNVVNRVSVIQRDVQDVRKKFSDFRAIVKKKASGENNYIDGTVGCPASAVKYNNVEEAMLPLIEPTAIFGLVGGGPAIPVKYNIVEEAMLTLIEPNSVFGLVEISENGEVTAIVPEKGPLLNEGKTKQIYECNDDPEMVVVLNKDRITAFNAKVEHQLEGKAECSNVTNQRIFQYLNRAGIKTSFERVLDCSSYLARRCNMVPIEWVTRRIATGSFLKRNPGVKEGYRFTPVMLETFYKDDANDDPQWSKAQVLSIPLEELKGATISESQYRTMAQTTIVVFEVLERAWAAINCTLVDMKIEFGIDNITGEILLSDVIDNDSWRLWEGGKKELMKDKQVYRNLKDYTEDDLKKVKLNYTWVKDKLEDFTNGPTNTVVLMMGSASDAPLAHKVEIQCRNIGLSFVKRVMSAHKVTEQTLETLQYYNSFSSPVVYIAVAGRSNGLGPVMSGNTTLPVINCPPINMKEGTHDIWSSLNVPSGLGCTTALYPECAVLSAASVFAVTDHRVWSRLRVLQLDRVKALDKADQFLQQ